MLSLPEPTREFLGEKRQPSKICHRPSIMAEGSEGPRLGEERPERKAGRIDLDRRERPRGWGGQRVAPSRSTVSPTAVPPLTGPAQPQRRAPP